MSQPISQVYVNEAARLCARFDTLIEDIQRSCELMIMEADSLQAHLAKRETVKCEKCRIDVDVSKLNLPGRCRDRGCPLRKDEQK